MANTQRVLLCGQCAHLMEAGYKVTQIKTVATAKGSCAMCLRRRYCSEYQIETLRQKPAEA